MLKVAILGYGGIARAHRKGYELLAKKRDDLQLVALCDIDPEQFSKQVAINSGNSGVGDMEQYRTYTDLDEMLAKEEPDVIDICLPSYLHCEYATMLLRRGYNVQCEKPMGLNSEQCNEMVLAAKESGKGLMIGMCLRFDKMYTTLKKFIDEETFGKVTSAFFERLSALPRWGFDGWFRDYSRSGGAALDMHIHDVDMIRYLFGEPKAISAVTSDTKMKCTTVHSTFRYDDKIITAIGDWGKADGWHFSAGYTVNFEKATLVLANGVMTVYPDDAAPYEYDYDPEKENNHMAAEISFFADTILGKTVNDRNTPQDAADSVRMIETIMKSAEAGGILLEV